jgi:hypothetical protein
MKNLTLFFIVPCLLFSCAEDCTPLEVERDAIKAELVERDSMISAIGNTFGLIDSNLISLKSIELELNMELKKPVKNEEAIKLNVEKMKAIMELNKGYIAELQGSLDMTQSTASSLFNIINSMEQKIVDNNLRLARVNHDLGTMGADFKGLFDEYLQAEVSKMMLEENLAQIKGNVSSMEAKLEELNNQLNTVYVAIGTKRELIASGVLEKGGVLKQGGVNEDFDPMTFMPYDIRELEQIQLQTSKARLVTVHPTESYRIADKVLYIEAPKLFWSISKFLIIVTD